MSLHAFLWIGVSSVVILSWREGYDPEIAALFKDEESDGKGKYSISAKTMRERLNLLGYTRDRTTKIVEDGWADRKHIEDKYDEGTLEELVSDYMRNIGRPGEWPGAPNESEQRFQEQLGYIWGQERATLKYIVDRLDDDVPVVMDLSELVQYEDMNVTSTVCSEAWFSERLSPTGAVPAVVLVEGTTDAQLLARVMRLRRPQYCDYLTFFDYSRKPSGGVASVVQAARAFAAAGIGNQTLALFDNDAEGKNGLKQLSNPPLPASIHIATLPDLPHLESYPAIGPDGEKNTDIRGRAASLELYFGEDILMPDSEPSPIQWTAYRQEVKAYQGSLIAKTEIQNRFDRKLKQAEEGTPDSSFDWEPIEAVLEHIVAQFT